MCLPAKRALHTRALQVLLALIFVLPQIMHSQTITINSSPTGTYCIGETLGDVEVEWTGLIPGDSELRLLLQGEGTVFATQPVGTINGSYTFTGVTIPGSVSAGNYRTEVQDLETAASGLGNSIDIRNLEITGLPTGPLCAGQSYSFDYTANSTLNSGNILFLEMSDGSGNFSDPTVIGSIATTSGTGSINGLIPFGTNGSGYRFRVRSTDPMQEGCETETVDVEEVLITSEPTNDPACMDGTANFSATASGSGLTYQWESLSLPFFQVPDDANSKKISNDVAKNASFMFSASNEGLFRSNDGGMTFTLSATSADGLPEDNIQRLFVRGSTVLASTASGLGISSNNGGSFSTRTTSNGLGSNAVNGTFIDVSGNIYVGTQAGLSISTNGGSSFTNYTTSDGLGNDFVNSVFVTGTGSNRTIYVATSSGLSIAFNGSTDFVNLTTADGLLSNTVNAVAATTGGLIFAGTNLGVSRSSDRGASWTDITPGLPDPAVSRLYLVGDLLFATTIQGFGVAGIDASGFSTFNKSFGLPLNVVSGMAISESGGVFDILVGTPGGIALSDLTVANMPGETSDELSVLQDMSSANDRYRLVVTSGDGCTRTTRIVSAGYIPPPIDYEIEQELDRCDLSNGQVYITGLLPGTMYTLNRSGNTSGTPTDGDEVSTDTLGRILLYTLGAGDYTVSVSSLETPFCESKEVNFTLDPPPSPTLPAGTANPICPGDNLIIEMSSSLDPSEVYQWYEDENGSSTADPSSSTGATYTPSSAPATSGSYYVRVRDNDTYCVSDTVEIPFTVGSGESISVSSSSPTSDGGNDGSFTIEGLTPLTNYDVEYRYGNGTTQNANETTNNDGEITINGLVAGVYNGIRAIGECPSNTVNSVVLFNPSDNNSPGDQPSAFRNTIIIRGGDISGYFQQSSNPAACTGSSTAIDSYSGSTPVDGIAVGIVRDPEQPAPPAAQTDVEMRGWVKFYLEEVLPEYAVIEQVEYRPVAVSTYGKSVCDVPLLSASGDIQFDVTRMETENYGPYLYGYDEDTFDDMGHEKYNDFVIAQNETGSWTDLGGKAVEDIQKSLEEDAEFQVGLNLSFGDFGTAVYQFHGMVFAPAEEHEIRITYYQLDYGDLPEPKFTTDEFGGIRGPSHRIDSIDVDEDPGIENMQPNMFIGATPPDAEPGAFPNTLALGDDNTLNDDEDLSSDDFFNTETDDELWAGDTINFLVPVTNNYSETANLLVFIDWNNNGVFENDTESYTRTVPGNTSEGVLFRGIEIPEDVGNATIGVRVRLTSGAIFDAYGPAPDGEVEDFFVDVSAFDYGDLPENELSLGGSGDYETTFSLSIPGLNGPRHMIRSDLTIGASVDAEGNGIPQINAFGDDLDGVDDEDGVFPPDTIIRGQNAVFQVFVRNQTSSPAYLHGFVDWNDDGSFEDGYPEQKSGLVTIPAGQSGLYPVTFLVPNDLLPLPGRVAARFRLSTNNVLITDSEGPFAEDIDGEVEDVWVTITGLDWGDLPEPLYATDDRGQHEGPSHQIATVEDEPGVFFPSLYIAGPPDADPNGQPSALADGDNNDGYDDEELDPDFFNNPLTGDSLLAGNTIQFAVPFTNNTGEPAFVSVFIDWDENGIFENDQERYSMEAIPDLMGPGPLDAGTALFNLNIPPTTPTGLKGVRVRISTQPNLEAYGYARDGEVEDFMVNVYGYDYGDLPDNEIAGAPGLTAKNNYETIFNATGERGPRHLFVEGLALGTLVDAEGNGQPQLNSVGDDVNGIDDEDGIEAPDTIVRGTEATFRVFVTNTTASPAYLQGFVDWNDDGDFEDPYPSQKANLVTIPANGSGWYNVVFDVPQEPNPLPQKVAARFRLSDEDTYVLLSTGPNAGNDIAGEVEDMWVNIVGYDWGDLPEPRYLTDREGGVFGPSHKIVPIELPDDSTGVSLHIGATVPDAEAEGRPGSEAMRDDNDLTDDEDLTADNFINPVDDLPYPIISGEAVRFRVPVTNNSTQPAYLFAFIDWNGDGDFVDSLETTIQTVTPGTNDYDFDYIIPRRPEADTIGVRVRLTTELGIDAHGPAPDGEVEDFMVEIRGTDYGDLPDPLAGLSPNDFHTLRDQNGPRHGVPVTPLTYMGARIDTESNATPGPDANGDDLDNQSDDEDGVIFLTPLVPGQDASISVSAVNDSAAMARVIIWTDWENDGVLDSVTQVDVPGNGSLTSEVVTFEVPSTATFQDGNSFWRLRITTDAAFLADPSPDGLATDGEVEDYFVPMFKVGNLVWEDRNNNGLQDADEINLGIDSVRVIMRFGGIDPVTGEYDGIAQDTDEDPYVMGPEGGADMIEDFIIDTLTDTRGLYLFTGMIEGNYQLITIDPSGLTPTRADWIRNVTEEDTDNDGNALEQPWEYADTDIRQSKTEVFTMYRDSIGTDEEGILDQGNPQLQDPNALEGFPDNRVEQRIDFGYTPFDFGDLPDTYTTVEDGVDIGTTQDGLFAQDTVLVGNVLEGPKHIVTPDIYLGSCSDAEVEGAPDFDAGQEFAPAADGEGDDPNNSLWDSDNRANTCEDDDNGVQFMTPLIPGYEAIIDVDFWATINDDGPDAYLQAFLDWNGDGDFYVDGDPAMGFDEDEHIVFTLLNGAPAPLDPNTHAVELEMSQQLDQDPIRLTFQVPDSAKYFDGNVLARFRISKRPNMAATGILPGNSNFPDGIVPAGEVEDYFMKLVKIGNIVWEDRDYDGIQDEDEPGIAGVEITLDYFGENDTLDGDFYENTYVTETDSMGLYYFYGLIGNVDPSGVMDPFYTLTASDPEAMTPTIDIDSIAPGDESNCITLNSDGNDIDIDDRITAVTFRITNPMGQCTGEMDPDGKLDMGEMVIMAPDNIWPDEQMDETFDFGYVGFDYGDLPDTSIAAEFLYRTKRDWLPQAPIDFGPRHAIQPKLYLGGGVDAELDGQPDDDAGSKEGGDDDVNTAFAKGDTTDDESGIRLLSPLLPGERAFIQVTYTSQDTVLAGGYADMDAFLNAFIDFNGDGDLEDATDAITFTHQGTSLTTLVDITDTTNPTLPGGDSLVQVLAFTVPDTSITDFNDGVAFMRYRLSWEGDLGPNNNDFHQTTPPFVDTSVEYPRGEVEDYAIPVARIGNLAWYDHNVNGHQDDPLAQLYNMYQDEYGVDTLHLVLIWGGVDAATGEFDTVGYNDETMSSAGAVEDILYNLSIAMPTGGAYDPAEILKTNAQGLYTFYGLIPGTYNLIPLKYLQTDSASFVDFWPKHRVLTLTDNPDAPDDRDSDACPGIVFTIDDANDKDPEVCVDNLVEGEDGELDDVDPTNPTFADNQWDQTLDLGWVDEPNIEANLDIVGVNFPTSEICGNFNVIMHLCVKNPTEVPLDSLMMTLNLREAYGGAFYAATKPMISIVDSSFVTTPADVKIKKTMAGSKEALTPFINPNYDGEFNLDLLTGGDKDTDFFLPGDSVICVRVEFEIDPTQTDAYTANGWASQFKAFGRAVGFLYEDAGAGRTKRPLIDKFPKSPRFGQYIEVMDLSDELDDPMPMAGMNYPEAGDSILFEGMVADRGDFGEYQVFMNNLTGRDKYLDEDDKTLQNDECWIDTRFIGGQDDINVSMDANCEVNIMPNMVIADHIAACGFDKYPEGSYYRVIIQDKKTEETLWASVDREPFDVRPYLDRELIYKARSVANHCQVVWGNITFEDKTAPVVTCPDDTGESLTTGLTLVCSDIDSVLNNAATFEDPTHPYYTGIATAVDGCGPTYLDRVQDVLRVFADCEDSAQAGYAYARITRTFTFRDAFNNTDTCKQQIYFYRPEIVLPECQVFIPNVVAGTDTILTSEDMIGKYELPESVPYFINGGGERVYLLGDEVCGFSVNYENRSNFITGDCGRKIIRRWRIFDWCYATGDNYPDYLVERGECYDDATREGSIYTFEQTIVIGDTAAPVVTIPDLDLDGFKGSGYKGGPAANADSSTATYDADDRYVFTTRPQDCFADFRVTRDMWEVEEQSEWCFDVGVYIRRPILDLDERPTGEWMIMPDTDAEITGNCDDGYLITNVEMIKDTFVDYFLRMRFVDVCDKDTIIWAPINIVDDIMPVVVCDDELEVTFDNVGTGNVAAIDVDEGTNDNCGFIRWLKVRRPLNECGAEFATIPHYVDANGNGAVDAGDWVDENRNEIADELEFFTIVGGELYSPLLDKVPFFCCDRDSVKVELWAEDWAGNRNSCWTWADLTDRPPIDYTLPGNYTLPDNVTYNCEAEEGKVLILAENEGTHAEGSLVYQTVVAMFGRDVVFSDRNNTCPGFTTEVIVEADIDDCGFGTIEVTWLISNGDEVRNAGTRIITIAALHDYYLRLPADQTASCGDDVGIRGVAFSEDACDLIAISTEDERFTATQDPTACYKIFRTYRIINWCEYDGEAQPTIVSRDWDGWNGTNPVSPDGDDEPGDEDIYVIVKRDFADDLPDTVYYDNNENPYDNSVVDGDDEYGYWWRVTSGSSDPTEESYYEAYYDAETVSWYEGIMEDERSVANIGKVYAMTITGDDTYYEYVWGTDVYTDDSYLPTAAVHAGILQDGETKQVFVRLLPGRESYTGSNRNGVMSQDWDSWGGSYEILTGSVWANDGDQTDSDITGNAQSDDIDQRYGSFGYWQYTQHIVVYDDVDPTLTITGADTFAAISNEDCAGDVTLQIEATDICTDDALDVTVQVILDGEDISDQLVDGVFTGRYEEGEYTLLVIADDGCGNVTTERYTFVVEDRKGPAPIVIDAISIELMPSEDEASGGGMAEVWASDFIASDIFDCNGQDATVTDANGNPRVTKYSINVVGEPVDMDQAGLSFTCADAARTIEVEIHGWDTKGNHDFAVTNLLVQDNMGVCDAPAGEGQIAGTIATEAGDAVNEVEVQLSGDRSSVYMTNATGTYAFTGLREDFDFSVIPGKDLFHGNGVSTFDLILIQRHILGSQAIASPYAQIAADVNKSGNISTLDMIQLRRLILNAGSRFENNTSWRFVAEDYVFPNPNNAFATSFPEVKNFNNLQGEEEANFVAVKVGDVNGSAMAYVQPRSDRGVTIDVVAPEVLKAGQTYSIALSSDELAAISGMQFTLQWAEGLELVDIASGVIGAEHMGVFTDERALATSWNQPSEVIADGELLTLSLKATTDVALSEALRLNSRLTRVESYDVATDEVMSVFLSSSEAYTSDEAELYQNVPNPFVTETRIGFYLPSAGTAELTIRDVAGRVLRTIDGDYEAGYNEVRLDRQSLPAGTLYYTLSYDGYQLTKVMMHNR